MNTLFNDILKNLKAVRGMAINDHRSATDNLHSRLSHVEAIALSGERVVCVIPDADQTQCCNSLYIGEDGMVHIGRNAVAIVEAGDVNKMLTNVTKI